VANPKQCALFCECIINKPEMIDDASFRTNELRLKNLQTLNEIIKPIFRTRKADEWLDLLDGKGIPCGKINNIAQVIDHPQVKAREMIVDTNHPAYGLIKLAGIPIKLSLTPGKVTRPAPVLGEHTSEILKELLSHECGLVGAIPANHDYSRPSCAPLEAFSFYRCDRAVLRIAMPF
jgi:CoA:oxalate CoA-transferase